MKQLPHVLNFPPASTEGEWWKDQIICGDSRAILHALPNKCIHLAITSPPYNVGLEYDSHNDNMTHRQYLAWLMPFWAELYRVLVPGGRFALNVAPTSIKNFRPIHYDMARRLISLGFIMRTEVLWYKQTMRRRTAWGSWKSPHNPHMVPSWEYVLVFSKGSWTLEGNKADADITGAEFIKFSDAFWQIPPETRGRQPFLKSLYPPRRGRKAPEAKAAGHPAPFPEELIYRLIKFYSYRGNVVLDPFGGIGTVAAVAHRTGRHFVHLDLSKKYCAVAADRVAAEMKQLRFEGITSGTMARPLTPRRTGAKGTKVLSPDYTDATDAVVVRRARRRSPSIS
ncbi:MAG: site-specific DNA-methyltransferase [Verrucomicrobiia bacterium]|jgi:DNA modification methylase